MRRRGRRRWQRISAMADAVGFSIKPPAVLTNSRAALAATEFARESGRDEALEERIYRAYFNDGENIGDAGVVARLAGRSWTRRGRGRGRDKVAEVRDAAEEQFARGASARSQRRADIFHRRVSAGGRAESRRDARDTETRDRTICELTTMAKSIEQRVQELEDRDEIKELTARYCWHVAHGEGEAVANLFTDDGVLDVQRRPTSRRCAGARRCSSFIARRCASRKWRLPFIQNHIIDAERR